MEKDTNEVEKKEEGAEEYGNYIEDDDYNDEYIIERSLGNMKDDPASKRSRPRNTPISKLQISDEDSIPKMPTKLLPKPNENQFNTKIKEIDAKIESKKKSIDQIREQKKKEIENLKGASDAGYQERFQANEMVKTLRAQFGEKEKETEEIRRKSKEATDELKAYERLGCGTNEKKVRDLIKNIQEQLSFGDISVPEEKRLSDKKADLENYLKLLKKTKPIKEQAKKPIEELNKLRTQLKEAQKKRDQIYEKYGITKTKSKEDKKEKKPDNPEIARLNTLIDTLYNEKRELIDEKRKIQDEYNQQWYDYEAEQRQIEYIKKAQKQIKYLKDKANNEKKLKKREEKRKAKGNEEETEQLEVNDTEKPKPKKNDEKLKKIEIVEGFFKTIENGIKANAATETTEQKATKISQNTKIDEDMKKGKLKEFVRDESFGFELGITGAGIKNKKDKRKKRKKEKEKALVIDEATLVLDINILEKIADLKLSPPLYYSDVSAFLADLNNIKEELIKTNTYLDDTNIDQKDKDAEDNNPDEVEDQKTDAKEAESDTLHLVEDNIKSC